MGDEIGKSEEDPFGLSTGGADFEDDALNDTTFGDIGPLTDDWEDQHNTLSKDLETEIHGNRELKSFFNFSKETETELGDDLGGALEDENEVPEKLQEEMLSLMLSTEEDDKELTNMSAITFDKLYSSPSSARTISRYYQNSSPTPSIWGLSSPRNTPDSLVSEPSTPPSKNVMTVEELEKILTGQSQNTNNNNNNNNNNSNNNNNNNNNNNINANSPQNPHNTAPPLNSIVPIQGFFQQHQQQQQPLNFPQPQQFSNFSQPLNLQQQQQQQHQQHPLTIPTPSPQHFLNMLQQQQQPLSPLNRLPIKPHLQPHLMVNLNELQKLGLPPQEVQQISSRFIEAAQSASIANLPSIPGLPIPPPSTTTGGTIPLPTHPMANTPPQQQNFSPHAQRGNSNQHYSPNYHRQNAPRPVTLGDMLPRNLTGARGGSPQKSFSPQPQYQHQQQHHQFQAHSHPHPHSISPNYAQSEPFNKKWPGPKKYMSSEEIATIIRTQYYQLQGNFPYVDDYYYYQLILKRSKAGLPTNILEGTNVGIINFHRPLYDSTAQRTTFKKSSDFLQGVLGRLPSHSIRAPRPLLQLMGYDGEKAEGEGSSQRESSVQQALLMGIEGAYNVLLDIEDMDLIIEGITNSRGRPESSSFNLQNLISKRESFCGDLFRALHIDGYPILNGNAVKPSPQQIPGSIFPPVSFEDDNFVGMFLVPKGKRLLLRVMKIFSFPITPLILPLILAFLRNLFLFVLVPNTPSSLDLHNKLFTLLSRTIYITPVGYVLHSFSTLLTFHSQPGYIRGILQSKEGLMVVSSILARGSDVVVFSQTQPDPDPTLQWPELFNTFYSSLTGQLRNLFGSALQAQAVDFLVSMAHNANDSQRREMGFELRDIILSHAQNTSLNGSELTQIRNLQVLLHLIGPS